jgi:branched-chain amino acid transport system ATP-binding protein
MTPALQLQGVHKRFGATTVLSHFSLSVASGERLALVGPNGAGKSTLFNLISGQCAPSAGAIMLHGRPIAGRTPQAIARMGLARSFQISQVFTRMTVADNLRCACLASLGHGLNPFKRLSRLQAVNDRVDLMLECTGLHARAQALAGELSYADQRRLELGMALAGNPQVLLLDEPTAGMSRTEAQQATQLIRTLTEGRTLLLVEHDMDVVFELADRVAVLDQGQLLACDRPAAIRANPRVQAAYLNALPADPAKGAAC